ncbi:MAG TPA: LamG domain-containing protein [Candidatus Elarobacter sp.]
MVLCVFVAACGGRHAAISALPGGVSGSAHNKVALSTTDSYGTTVMSDAPVAYYRLADAAGSALTDETANHLNGTYGSGVTHHAASLIGLAGDYAASFPGTTASSSVIALLPPNALLQPSTVTVEAWIRMSGAQTTTVDLVSYGNQYNGQGYTLQVIGSNQHAALFLSTLSTPGYAYVEGTTALASSTTYHLVGTYDGTTAKIYVNGVLDASAAGAGAPDYSRIGGYGLSIGGGQNSTRHSFLGSIDEAAVYPSVLSASRIAAHAQAGGLTNVVTNGVITVTQSASGTTPSGGGSSVSVTLPRAPAMGNVLVAAVMWTGDPVSTNPGDPVTFPPGFRKVDAVADGSYAGIAIAIKAVQSGDAAGPFTFGMNAARYIVATVDEASGVDVVRTANTWGNATGSGRSLSVSTSANPTISNGMPIAYFAQYNGGATPTGFTAGGGYVYRQQLFDTNRAVAAQELIGTTRTTAGTGVSASQSYSNGENSDQVGEIVILAPNPGTVASGGPTYQGCPMFSPSHPFNTDISGYSVSSNSSAYIQEMLTQIPGQSGSRITFPWIDAGPQSGMPINVVNLTPTQYTNFVFNITDSGPGTNGYKTRSDQGPFPFGSSPLIEEQYRYATGAYSDHHMILMNTANCGLYEMEAVNSPTTPYSVDGTAVYTLNSDAQRPEGWGTVEAAGMAITPLLLKSSELQAGVIKHALRFHVDYSTDGYIHPATHSAPSPQSGTIPRCRPPMGARLRLKANFNYARLNGYPEMVTIAHAMQKYGMYVSDNGANGGVSTDYNPSYWGQTSIVNEIDNAPSLLSWNDFEFVNTGSIIGTNDCP